MRAAVYRGRNTALVEEVPRPELAPGEVLVRVDTCGVCGTDIKKIQYGLVPPPRIFGHETAGTIAEIAPGVSGWRVGDRVAVFHHVPCQQCYYCRRHAYAQCETYKRTGCTAGFAPAGGGFAEYVRVMDWIVRDGMIRLPDDVSFEEASFLEPLNTCLKAVRSANVQAGDTVLIIGQGPIGLLFTQLVALHDARALVSDLASDRRAMALRLGAQAAYDPAEVSVPDAVKEATQGRGADLALIAVPNNAVVAEAFAAIRPGGGVLLFAQTRKDDSLTIDAGAVCMDEKSLLGSYSSDIRLNDECAQLIFNRRVQAAPLITHRFPLEAIGEALALAIAPRDQSLKIVIKPGFGIQDSGFGECRPPPNPES